MNISKENLEVLFLKSLASSIKTEAPERNFPSKAWFEELLFKINETSRTAHVHFIYNTECSEWVNKEKSEIVEFSLTAKTNSSKEYLWELEDKVHVDANCLYLIIMVLQEM